MFSLSSGDYSALCLDGGMPDLLPQYFEHACLSERFDLSDPEGRACFFAVGHRACRWPFLVIAQRYSPSGAGFRPGALIVPETRRLFLGAGERLLGYDLTRPARLWEGSAPLGFWCWERHDDMVLMSAELELAAWHVLGNKRWSVYVEPPWSYEVNRGIVRIEVMGRTSRVELLTGRPV